MTEVIKTKEEVKKSIIDMEVLKLSKAWGDIKTELEAENAIIIEELYNKCPDEIKLTIHDLRRTQLVLLTEITPRVMNAIGSLDGSIEVKKFLDGKYSVHDLIRNKVRFIKKLFVFPDEFLKDANDHYKQIELNESVVEADADISNIDE
jgi:hypothetical protein